MDGGHRAIIFNRLTGVKEGVMSEGMHFVVPWFEWPYIYDVRTKPRNVQVRDGSIVAGARAPLPVVRHYLYFRRGSLVRYEDTSVANPSPNPVKQYMKVAAAV